MRARGFSLLEVGLGLLLLTAVGGLLILFFARMFGVSAHGDAHLYAATQLDGVTQVFRIRAKQNWPTPVDIRNAPLEDNFYDVEDLGPVANPVEALNPISLKQLVVRLRYKVRYSDGSTEEKEISNSILVGR